REKGVGAVICGGIGGGARLALAQAGILVYGGVQGDADAAVQAWLDNSLTYDPNARCTHHDEEHGDHACGGHTCGGHTCGGQS
ncbi:MAG: NifB/NifX family molybdenum-iron cluster-binding protein, partial [Aristaeellaceae bacterium]